VDGPILSFLRTVFECSDEIAPEILGLVCQRTNFVLRISIPALGIMLELFGARFAKWVNVGYLTLAGILLCLVAAFNWSDFHGRLYLVFWSTNVSGGDGDLSPLSGARPEEREAN
jgi:hypothetical protein